MPSKHDYKLKKTNLNQEINIKINGIRMVFIARHLSGTSPISPIRSSYQFILGQVHTWAEPYICSNFFFSLRNAHTHINNFILTVDDLCHLVINTSSVLLSFMHLMPVIWKRELLNETYITQPSLQVLESLC